MPSTSRQRYVYARILKLKDALELLPIEPGHEIDRYILEKSLNFYTQLKLELEQKWGLPQADRKTWGSEKVREKTRIEIARREIATSRPEFRLDLNDWS
jgi:hypothetical protein